MASACEFPDELITKPLGFVALVGLEVNHNAMHRSIWDTFTVNRRQEKVLNIQLLPGDAEFPKKKNKQVCFHAFYYFTYKNIIFWEYIKSYGKLSSLALQVCMYVCMYVYI